MKNIIISIVFVLSACGTKELAEAIKEANQSSSSDGSESSASEQPAAQKEANAALEIQLLGQWDLYSRNCDGPEFSFEFENGGTCYLFKKYGQRYKCNWSWVGNAQMKFCVGADCRTDMYISFKGDMMTIKSSKCETEYKRPKLID